MENGEFRHVSVLLEECMDALDIKQDGVYVDCTAGGGGHSSEIARRLGENGRLICLDRDDEAICACRRRLEETGANFTVVKSNYSDIAEVLDGLGIDRIDGVLWDLGVSSRQLDTPERGFSYMADAPLDMRMDTGAALTAADVVNGYTEDALSKIIFEYGEEKFARKIASAIVKRRETAPIETTSELVEVIRSAMPAAAQRGEAQHPAKRTFQAIRIEVNGELAAIEPSVRAAVDRLKPGGRAAVITFHSLEDRIVKNLFRTLSSPCTCTPDFQVCVCGKKPSVRLITKKPVISGAKELALNPRARSAKLRIAEKI